MRCLWIWGDFGQPVSWSSGLCSFVAREFALYVLPWNLLARVWCVVSVLVSGIWWAPYFLLYFKNFFEFIYWPEPGLHCGTRDLFLSFLLSCAMQDPQLWHVGFFSCSIRTFSWGMWDLIPRPGIKPWIPALEAQSPSHWTTREVPRVAV